MKTGSSKLQNKTSKQLYCKAVTVCFGYTELKISIKKQDASLPCSHSEHTGWSFLVRFSSFVRARPKITTF